MRILTAAVFAILSVASALAQSDARKDYEEKARKAAEAQLPADWAKLDQFVARLNLYLVQDEELWLKHLPAFEALADRRSAARDDKDKLSALDLELQQLLERMSEERPAGFGVDEGYPDPLEDGYGFFAQVWPELVQRLRDATESRQQAHGAEDATVQAQKARLAAAELTMRKFDAANDAIDARAKCESDLRRLREMHAELSQKQQQLAAADKARDAAEKARDDYIAKPPAASAPEAEHAAYRKKAAELGDAYEEARSDADTVKSKVEELDADLRAHEQAWDVFVQSALHEQQYAKEALTGRPEWHDVTSLAEEEHAAITHVRGLVHESAQVEVLAGAKGVTHLRLSTSHPMVEAAESAELVRQLFQAMTQLPKLQSVEVHFLRGGVDAESVKLLAAASSLDELKLTAPDWGDAGALTALGALKLRRLELGGALSGKPLAKHVAGLTGAAELNLKFVKWPVEKGLPEALAALPNLRSLVLDGLSDEAIATVLMSKSLREISCGKLGRATAEALKANQRVTGLDLSGSPVTSSDLAVLADATHLRRLVLAGCAELDEFAIGNLRKLVGLEELDLLVSGVPDWSVRVLRKHMPKCRITN
jgi:hypothetical protein